jgi:alkanesulfonate monooxygenase SsuD/methylene tetrahydromethanopterin reductase-like flavin-dependent oxidoreductase (luciferase family)
MLNIDPPGQAAEVFVRRYMAAYLNVPVYKAFQEWLGRTAALTPMWQAWSQGDRRGAIAAIPSQVVDDLIIRGTPEEMRAHIHRYLAAGVDTVFLHLTTLETEPLRQRQILLEALRHLAPGQD